MNIMANAVFQVGQRVKAGTDKQGLALGSIYKVVDVARGTGPFGVTTYVVEGADGARLSVINGHLLLSPLSVTARIEYTVEVRGRTARRAREVSATEDRIGDVVEREIDKLVDRGGFNFDTKYTAAA